MIRQPASGLQPILDVAINRVPVSYDSIRNVEVRMNESQHDIAIVTLSGIPPRYITEYLRSAVYVKIDLGGNLVAEFHGYVNDVRPEASTSAGYVNDSPFHTAELWCLGASYDMRSKRNYLWDRSTLADVVRTFGKRYGFSADVPSDTLVVERLGQTNESDWQFLVRYADLLGYKVNVHGAHIHVYDPFKAVGRQVSVHRVEPASINRTDSRQTPGQILSFSGSFSERHSDGEYRDTVVTVTDDYGNVYPVSTNEVRRKERPARYTSESNEFVHSYAEAVRYIESASKNSYDYHAELSVFGIPGCKPGGIISVDRYASEFDGLWYVNGVTHVLNSNGIVSHLDVSRNRISQLVTTNVAAFREPPAAQLIDGKWRARTGVVNVY